jgi:hypothetical protein
LKSFPFLFKNHGTLLIESFTKGASAYIGFVKAPTRAQVEKIARGAPRPIRGMLGWTDTLLACSSWGDTFDWEMLEHYGTDADKKASMQSDRATFEQPSADRFAADVERWVKSAHAIAPVAWCVGPCAASGGDAWDEWTCANMAAPLVDFLEAYVKRNKLAADFDYEAGELGKITKDTIACLLQEFDGQGLEVPKALEPRITKLRKAHAI